MDYVWDEYKIIILDKINNKGNINESTSKISREDYVDKILNYLVEDTIIDFKEDEIRFPFSPTLQYFHPLSSPFSLFNHLILFFSKYCKYNYDLTENEMDYVWNEYKNIIWDKINEVYPDEV